MTASVQIPGDPVPKARPRVAGRRAYTPARTQAAEDRIRYAWNLAAERWQPMAGATYGCEIEFRCATRRRVDIDNLAKTVLDALNGLAWIDDAQVAELRATKRHDRTNPGTSVTVWREGGGA